MHGANPADREVPRTAAVSAAEQRAREYPPHERTPLNHDAEQGEQGVPDLRGESGGGKGTGRARPDGTQGEPTVSQAPE